LIFTSNLSVIKMVNELSILLAFTILLNCIQPVLSGKYLMSIITIPMPIFELKITIFDAVVIDGICWFSISRRSNWIWPASSSGLYKHRQLLLSRNTSWDSTRLVTTFRHCGKCHNKLIFFSTLA
jgi:hypothetical protein